MSGDSFGVTAMGGAIVIQGVEAKDEAKHLTKHRTAPFNRIMWPQLEKLPRLRILLVT